MAQDLRRSTWWRTCGTFCLPVVEWYLNNDPEEREIKPVKWELEKDVEQPVDSTTTPHRIWLTQRSALLVSKILSIVAE